LSRIEECSCSGGVSGWEAGRFDEKDGKWFSRFTFSMTMTFLLDIFSTAGVLPIATISLIDIW
jgi:hypothetical protein